MANDTLLAPDFFEKHYAKIDFAGPSECWLWNAYRNRCGYGRVRVQNKMCSAHREAYEASNGRDSAAGLVVRHKCDVRACVNPAHLEIGTVADNNRDMFARGRRVFIRLNGETNGSAKLTEADVLAIRAAHVRGSSTHSLRAIGQRFGIAHSIVSRIVNRQLWAHVKDPQVTA